MSKRNDIAVGPPKSDQRRLFCLLSDWDIPYDVFEEPKFLSEQALTLGAVCSIGIRSQVDIYFDAKGRFVGTTTIERGSFKRCLAKKGKR